MAYHSSAPRFVLAPLHGALDATKAFFAGIGRAMVMNSSGQKRLERAERLNAKTDAELAQMGIRRDDIPRIVFGDMWHI
jgi:uncharacterized protein YjiS (DUF1127 family)